MGLGGLGGGTQMLFGGSGGQDMFQKITWILTAIFLFGSLVLAIMKTSQHNTFKYIKQQSAPTPLRNTMPIPAPQQFPSDQSPS